jgi:lysophospholipase L1-like esterase
MPQIRLFRTFALLGAVASSLLNFSACAADDARPVENAAKLGLEQKKNPALPTLWLIGDSTVKVSTKGEEGWGSELPQFFDLSKINVVNRAIGGRSSRTFYSEGRWDDVVKQLQPGDFVLMQFGHNDAGAVNDNFRARASLDGTGEETQEIDNLLTKKHEIVHTFGWYLRKYVDDAKAKGAVPLVCSLIPRMIWKDGKIVRSKDNYAGWAEQVATQEKAGFVELNEIIAEQYDALGTEAVKPLFGDAHTHTTPAGAKLNAECVVAGVKALPDCKLKDFLSAQGQAVKPFRMK